MSREEIDNEVRKVMNDNKFHDVRKLVHSLSEIEKEALLIYVDKLTTPSYVKLVKHYESHLW